jgi:hypothetical protein
VLATGYFYNNSTRKYEEMAEMIRLKPDWLYQAMPFIYLLLGVAAVIYVDTPLGYVTGALLMLTACLIWMKRKTNQTEVRKVK